MNHSTNHKKLSDNMLSLDAPSGLLFNPNVKKYMNIRYDDFGKPVGRSVLGNKEEFVKHKKVKQSKSSVVKKGMTIRPSAMAMNKQRHGSNNHINSNESEMSTAQKSKTLKAQHDMFNLQATDPSTT